MSDLSKKSLPNSDKNRSKQLLTGRMTMTREKLSDFFDHHGINLPVLKMAMKEFVDSVLEIPEGTDCRAGCDYCCHLRVGVSIPEALVIYDELMTQATPEGLEFMRQRVLKTAAKGNTLDESFWLKTRTPCPFLDDTGHCLIYILRPFSCRAYHSRDVKACRESFEKKVSSLIPCFPIYRAVTDMYSSVFIRVLQDKGFPSFQTGFVRALEILFTDDKAVEKWLNKEDVFGSAKIESVLVDEIK